MFERLCIPTFTLTISEVCPQSLKEINTMEYIVYRLPCQKSVLLEWQSIKGGS